MLIRTSILLLVAACFAVAAQPDLPPAGVAPAPQTAELPLPDTPHVVAADPPRRRRAATDRDDGDAFAPGPGPSLAETPLNCSSIEGVTGNMPGVDLFYERASRQVERSQKKKLFLRYFLFFFYAYALRTPSLTATPAPQSPSSAASSPWSCPAACSTR